MKKLDAARIQIQAAMASLEAAWSLLEAEEEPVKDCEHPEDEREWVSMGHWQCGVCGVGGSTNA